MGLVNCRTRFTRLVFPSASASVSPPPVCNSASFSQGFIVMWYSPVWVLSTNSISISCPTPSRYRYSQVSKGKMAGEPTTFPSRSLHIAPGGMSFDTIGLTVFDVDHSTIRFPTRYSRGIVLIGILDTSVVFFLVFVVTGSRRGVPSSPELFDESFPFFDGLQFIEDRFLFRSDGIKHIFLPTIF